MLSLLKLPIHGLFLRPTVARDGAGLARLSEDKYRNLRLLGEQRLPAQPQQLFDRQPAEQPPAVPAKTFPVPSRALLEKPKSVDPASLGNGRGGESATPPPTQPTVARRHTIELIRGSNPDFMRALLQRHPGQPLRMEQRDQGYAILFSSYPNRDLALRALADLPAELPQRGASVIAER